MSGGTTLPSNMNTKLFVKVGTGLVFILLVILIVYAGLSRKSSTINSNNMSPTISSHSSSTTINTYTKSKLKTLHYPVSFESITIDLRPDSKSLIIFYPRTKVEAAASFTRFLNRQGLTQNTLGFSVHYIGTTLDPNEPPPGFTKL